MFFSHPTRLTLFGTGTERSGNLGVHCTSMAADRGAVIPTSGLPNSFGGTSMVSWSGGRRLEVAPRTPTGVSQTTITRTFSNASSSSWVVSASRRATPPHRRKASPSVKRQEGGGVERDWEEHAGLRLVR